MVLSPEHVLATAGIPLRRKERPLVHQVLVVATRKLVEFWRLCQSVQIQKQILDLTCREHFTVRCTFEKRLDLSDESRRAFSGFCHVAPIGWGSLDDTFTTSPVRRISCLMSSWASRNMYKFFLCECQICPWPSSSYTDLKDSPSNNG